MDSLRVKTQQLDSSSTVLGTLLSESCTHMTHFQVSTRFFCDSCASFSAGQQQLSRLQATFWPCLGELAILCATSSYTLDISWTPSLLISTTPNTALTSRRALKHFDHITNPCISSILYIFDTVGFISHFVVTLQSSHWI